MTSSIATELALITIVSFSMSYLGAAVGLVLGQVRVVLLTYALGSAAVGTATSLAISAIAAIAGALSHARHGRVRLALLGTIGIPSTIAAYGAARYAAHANPQVIKGAIAVALVLSGVQMVRSNPRAPAPDSTPNVPAPVEPSAQPESRSVALLAQVTTGAVLGAVSGIVGLLLGSLRLPAMVRFSREDPRAVVGTNMAIGAVTGLSGGLAAFSSGKVNLLAFALVSPLTLVGAHLGAQRTGQLDRVTLRRWIGFTLVPTGLMMIGDLLVTSRT